MCDTSGSWKTTDGPTAFSCVRNYGTTKLLLKVFLSSRDNRAHFNKLGDGKFMHFFRFTYFGSSSSLDFAAKSKTFKAPCPNMFERAHDTDEIIYHCRPVHIFTFVPFQ